MDFLRAIAQKILNHAMCLFAVIKLKFN